MFMIEDHIVFIYSGWNFLKVRSIGHLGVKPRTNFEIKCTAKIVIFEFRVEFSKEIIDV